MESRKETFHHAIDLENRFSMIDSVQVVFYEDPYGDSTRFARYFSFVATADSNILNAIELQLKQPYLQKTTVDTCRSEGKIILFSRQEAFKTIYFSGKCLSCCHIYFIKDGNFFYVTMLPELKEKIDAARAAATQSTEATTLRTSEFQVAANWSR